MVSVNHKININNYDNYKCLSNLAPYNQTLAVSYPCGPSPLSNIPARGRGKPRSQRAGGLPRPGGRRRRPRGGGGERGADDAAHQVLHGGVRAADAAGAAHPGAGAGPLQHAVGAGPGPHGPGRGQRLWGWNQGEPTACTLVVLDYMEKGSNVGVLQMLFFF